MQNYLHLFFIGLILILSGCKSNNQNKSADSTGISYIPSSAAVVDTGDHTHQFIRTADLKFKVENVLKSTYAIENVVAKNAGFVTYTNLSSAIDETHSTVISSDTLMETTAYTVSNNLVLRVPNTRLDTTLKEISKNILFLNFRIIKADDVALQWLANSMAEKRNKKSLERIQQDIHENRKKLRETTEAEEMQYNHQEAADLAQISKLTLQDKISYSTINLEIYQSETYQQIKIANHSPKWNDQPELGYMIGEAFKTGWTILKAFLVFIVNLWGIILIGLLGYFTYRWVRKRMKGSRKGS